MTASQLIWYIFQKFYDLLFTVEIESGVKIGWVIVVVMLFMIMIRSILNIPSGLKWERNKDNG